MKKLVEVTWLDSCSLEGGVWHSKKTAKRVKPAVCYSAGYVISESKKHITIAAHDSPYQTCGALTIPRGAITSMKKLKRK